MKNRYYKNGGIETIIMTEDLNKVEQLGELGSKGFSDFHNNNYEDWDYQSISLKPIVDEWNKHRSMGKSKQKGMKGLKTILDEIIEIYGNQPGETIVEFFLGYIEWSYKDLYGEDKPYEYILNNISNKIWIKLYRDLDKNVNEEMIYGEINILKMDDNMFQYGYDVYLPKTI